MLLYYWTTGRYVIAVDRYSHTVFPFHARLSAVIRLQNHEFNQSEGVIGQVVCGVWMRVLRPWSARMCRPVS